MASGGYGEVSAVTRSLMSKKVTGNIKGLNAFELKRVGKLYERRISANELISLDLARELCVLATEFRRRIGLLISREGHVEEVFLGTREILYMPDLGRYRVAGERLRRLRLVFSDLSHDEQVLIPTDIYTDLEKLRFDLVAGVKLGNNQVRMAYAHVVPYDPASEIGTATEQVKDLGRFSLDFGRFIGELERSLTAALPAQTASGTNRALLVGVYGQKRTDAEASLRELRELARTAGVEVAGEVVQFRNPDPKTLLGKGKLEDVTLKCLRLGAELLIFDGELKPGQWRNIANSTELKVIDRSMLILDIFAQRARSSEGRLQVELAQLKYNLPRLVEKDAGLSRLSGGIGGRGPGETKLEISRRRSRERIRQLEEKISQISQQRGLQRNRRRQQKIPLVAILGYTNAGKSTLFNLLSHSEVFVENKLFATLDPAQRRIVLPALTTTGEFRNCTFILSDTVGFIRQLPQELFNAFRATLEELFDAELLLHVIDGSEPDVLERHGAVKEIITEMGLAQCPEIVVINKRDLISEECCEMLENATAGLPVSAKDQIGTAQLLQLIMDALFPGHTLSMRNESL